MSTPSSPSSDAGRNKRVFVFCIGGTGLRVMKSIFMLLAAGHTTHGYSIVPVFIDPHRALAERNLLNDMTEQYCKVRRILTTAQDNGSSSGEKLPSAIAAPQHFFSTLVEDIMTLDGQRNNEQSADSTNQTFGQFIGLSSLAANDINRHLVATLFSNKSLSASLKVGFKGNPNVGTVALSSIIEGMAEYKAFRQHFQEGDRVFIISSIFGGTGASGFPLLEKKIREDKDRPALKDATMGAVTVLPYFKLTNPVASNSDIDSANFISKAKAALSYYEKTVKSDYLYYAGEAHPSASYDNNEAVQKDQAHFIELVAASALFDFLQRNKPTETQYARRAIASDSDTLTLKSLGDGYNDIVRHVAEFSLLSLLMDELPHDTVCPLRSIVGFDDAFYEHADFKALQAVMQQFNTWYGELSSNRRAFSPLSRTSGLKAKVAHWVSDTSLRKDGKSVDKHNTTHLILAMLNAARANKKEKETHSLLRQFIDIAHTAIAPYTKDIRTPQA